MKMRNSISSFRVVIGCIALALAFLTMLSLVFESTLSLTYFLLKLWPIELGLIVLHTVILLYEDYRDKKRFLRIVN